MGPSKKPNPRGPFSLITVGDKSDEYHRMGDIYLQTDIVSNTTDIDPDKNGSVWTTGAQDEGSEEDLNTKNSKDLEENRHHGIDPQW